MPSSRPSEASPARPAKVPVREAIPGLLQPSTLTPARVDLRRVFWAGTGLWAAAAAVFGVLAAVGVVAADTVAVCVAGVVLGFAALLWERRRGPDRRR